MAEPLMGLSPAYVEQVFDIIRTINGQGVTIFMVEQNANMALQIADRAYVLQTVRLVICRSRVASRGRGSVASAR
jgi:branched-chain amino acid transport system ATP-binding protein